MEALLITLGSFALILILARLKVPLSGAILIGGVVCGLGFRMSLLEILHAVGGGLAQPRTIALVTIVSCLIALSGTMQTGGQMKRIVHLAQMLLRRPVVTMVALPALIGMLPMPGGAMFSAPMVESAAGSGSEPPGKLSSINYWFRHVWEYWWPLFPGVMVAVTITNSSPGSFLLFHFPLSIITIGAGLVMLRRTHPSLRAAGPVPARGTKRSLLKATSSIWIVLVCWLIGKLVLLWSLGPPPRAIPGGEPLTQNQRLIAAVSTYLPIMIGLAISLLWTTKINRIDRNAAAKIWTDKRIYRTGLLVCSVMVFQYLLREADAAGRIADELTALRVPVPAVFAILPFVAGMVMGIAVGFVGTSFPILMGLLAATGAPPPPYIALAYLFGHMGQMISPLHVCHVVSHEYFNTGFMAGYRYLLPTAAITGILGSAYVAALILLMS